MKKKILKLLVPLFLGIIAGAIFLVGGNVNQNELNGATGENVEKDKIINSEVVLVREYEDIGSPTSTNKKLKSTERYVKFKYISDEETTSTPYFDKGDYSSAEYLPKRADGVSPIIFYAPTEITWKKVGDKIYNIKEKTVTEDEFQKITKLTFFDKLKGLFGETAFATTTVTTTGTFTPAVAGWYDVLLIAGGGSGGIGSGGGGAAGGYIVTTTYLTVQEYSVTVGLGGDGICLADIHAGHNGTTSSFNGISVWGGGFGGSSGYTPKCGTGGSGGGVTTPTDTGCAGTTGQGHKGGDSTTGVGSGAGAGATTDGGNTNGQGGIGATSTITGTAVCRAGGGPNSSETSYGSCGAGTGSTMNGTANTGGGGRAWYGAGSCSGNGGTGVVIIALIPTGGTTPTIEYNKQVYNFGE
jgi:hypothetical protein